MWRQVVAQSPGDNAMESEVLRYDLGWKALNSMLKSGRSLSGHERNCAFLNTGDTSGTKKFADISAAAGIDFDDDGRVVAPSDWDQDGDLVFWIANRTGPQARFMRNNTDGSNHWVQFKLRGTTTNRDAIGARIELRLSDSDSPLARTMRSGGGYLSQESKWLHFGLGRNTREITKISVRWPDGSQETISPVPVDGRYVITQGTGEAISIGASLRQIEFAEAPIEQPAPSGGTRIVLITPPPIPSINYQNAAGVETPILDGSSRAKLVTLWASWCTPCLTELNEWEQHAGDLQKNAVDVLAINIENLSEKETIDKTYAKLGVSFPMGYGTESAAAQFDVLQRAVLSRQRPLPLPSSFLIDGEGNLRVIYKGPVSVAQIIADASLIGAPLDKILDSAVPYPGIWLGQPAGASPNSIAVRFVEGGYAKEAESYLRKLTQEDSDHPTLNKGDALTLLGAILLDQNHLEESAETFMNVLKIAPTHRPALIELAGVLTRLKRHSEAIQYYLAALEKRQDDPGLKFQLGMAYIELGKMEDAIPALAASIQLRPSLLAHYNLGMAYLSSGKVADSLPHFESALKFDPRFLPAANNLAWLWSASADESIRNPKRAQELAIEVCAQPEGRTASHLDTLAVAHAANGNFEEAIEFAQESIRMAKAAGDLAAAKEVQQRLALYQKNQPYRDS